jgi:hypothetical protein
MPGSVRVMPSRRKHLQVKPANDECFDVEELANEAADALEAYRRAPWCRGLAWQSCLAQSNC